MRKSLYSIMLANEIMDAIDELANKSEVDSSDMLNQILAEYLSIKLPQMNMKEVFDLIELNMGQNSVFKVNSSLNDCMIYVKSPIEHEYRPALKYSVEIFDKNDIKIGKLKLIYRTYDMDALSRFNHFIDIWIALETHYIHKYFPKEGFQYEVDSGRFSRNLMVPKDLQPATSEILGQGISDYIKEMDELLKLYLTNISFDAKKIEKRYVEYLNKGIVL